MKRTPTILRTAVYPKSIPVDTEPTVSPASMLRFAGLPEPARRPRFGAHPA